MTDREIMQQALDALKQTFQFQQTRDVIAALETALAQPEQEPVAWMVRDQVDGCRYPSALKNPAGSINGESQPLYTAPPKREWVGLTDEEIKGILDCGRGGLVDIKKAEQILKEKNNAV